jgi:hypothetical protein
LKEGLDPKNFIQGGKYLPPMQTKTLRMKDNNNPIFGAIVITMPRKYLRGFLKVLEVSKGTF